MIKNKIKQIIENIIEAYESLREITGRDIPDEILDRVLGETEHIAIHELVHGAIWTVYPEIDKIEEDNRVFGECIDEVLGRLLEMYVSKHVGAYVHSFEEHVHELRYYTSLSGLDIKTEELEELYKRVSSLLEENRLREAIDIVVAKCNEWIKSNK